MRLDSEISDILTRATGAIASGCAELHHAPLRDTATLSRWLAAGHNAGMAYMANHPEIRERPELLLEGARSIISLAFNYNPAVARDAALPQIARFAYGLDYHDVLRSRISGAVTEMAALLGGEYRICIDSAPIFERYWAEECGIGRRADNGLIAVPGYGTYVLLAEIPTTLPIDLIRSHEDDCAPAWSGEEGRGDSPLQCTHCGACRRACPAGALQADGCVDARRCLSYLTIEHKGEWDATGTAAMQTPSGRRTLFGCDICQRVCPLNRHTPATEITEFQPIGSLLSLTGAEAATMTQPEFSRIFKGSPIKRSKLAGLLRNASNTLTDKG